MVGLILTLLGSLVVAPGGVAAQEDGTPQAPVPIAIAAEEEMTSVLVDAATCDAEECPPYTDFLASFEISAVQTSTGGVIDTCTTGTDGSTCELLIPTGLVNYHLEWQDAAVPTGFTYSRVDISDGRTGPPVHTIVFVPEGQERTTIIVDAATCDAEECPPYTNFLASFEISAVQTSTGGVIDTCTTGADGSSCELSIPTGLVNFHLEWSDAAVPAGYAYSRIDVSDGHTGPIVRTIVFVPESPERTTIIVDAATCDVDVCPPYSEFLASFDISAVQTSTGGVIDICTTGVDGSTCELSIPTGLVNYHLAWEDAQVPAGYAFSRIDTSDGNTGPRVRTIVFAPEGPSRTSVFVDAATCDAEECPPYTDFLVNFEISAVQTSTGGVIDTCTTGANGSTCELSIPTGLVNYHLEWNDDHVPAGYAFSRINISDGHTGPRVHTIVFVPGELILVQAATCTTANCPPYADVLPNFLISVYDAETDAFLDSCSTDPASQGTVCQLWIPATVADYYLSYDDSQVPSGFRFDRVDVSDGEMSPPVHTLVFVPDGGPTVTPDPTVTPHPTTPAPTAPATSAAISGLPSTGATPSAGNSSAALLLAVGGLLLAGAIAVGAKRQRLS